MAMDPGPESKPELGFAGLAEKEDRTPTMEKVSPVTANTSNDSGDQDQLPGGSENFLQKLGRSIESRPKDKVFATWYNNQGDAESVRTFHGIWEASGEIAYLLRVTWDLKKGDRVIMAFNFGLRFFVVFLGCLRAGVVAVPVYPPNPATMSKSLKKLDLIVRSCEPKMILVCPLVNKLRLVSKLSALATGSGGWPRLPYNCPDVKDEAGVGGGGIKSSFFGGGGRSSDTPRDSFDEARITADDVAFLQFTSGSTSDPKGVMLTFGNIEHNITGVIASSESEISARGGAPGDRRWFSWLPTFHDMGLIQGTLVPFVAGWSSAYCSPISFMRTPLIWLQLMSKEKSQMTAAPDFAYRLCVRKWNEMTPQARAALNLDLRDVMFMQNAAEPIRVSTVRDFFKTFALVGLPPHAVNAAFGLAEHTVGCAATSPNREGLDIDSISDDRLQASGEVAYASTHNVDFKIVDPDTCREKPVGENGELWVASPSVAAGYWGKPDLSRTTFHARILSTDEYGNERSSEARYLRTGDICRVDDQGLLFVEGRQKDVIIVRGRNLYPQDIEYVVQDAAPLVRPGCVAAFSQTELGGSIEIVLEVRAVPRKDTISIPAALDAVHRAVTDEFGLCPSRVVAIEERTIPKTTSGKIQRRKCRLLLHEGSLQVVHELSTADVDKISRPEQKRQQQQQQRQQASGAGGGAAVAVAGKRFGPAAGQLSRVLSSTERTVDLSESRAGRGLGSGVSGEGDRARMSRAGSGRDFFLEGPVQAQISPITTSGTTVGEDDNQNDPALNEIDAGHQPQGVEGRVLAKNVLKVIEAATGIEGLEASDDLLDLGVDSAMSVGISSNLAETAGVELPPEMVFTHPTAALIAEYINSLIPDHAEEDKERHASTAPILSWQCAGGSRLRREGESWTMGPMRGWRFRLLQVILLALVIGQVFVSIHPAVYVGSYLDGLVETSFWGIPKTPWLYVNLPMFGRGKAEYVLGGETRGLGLLSFLLPLAWFGTFTLLVIFNKWLVIGTHVQCRTPLSTRAYLCWWYVNAMLNVWEAVGGMWLLDTRLLIIFYRLLGARVAWTARIHSFIRDFDVVDIRDGAVIEGQLYVRRFEASHMVVMPIIVGQRAQIRAGSVVYGGSKVGQNCVIEPLTVVPPFSKLARNSVWEGHPAKAIKKGTKDKSVHSRSYESIDAIKRPCTVDVGALILELSKLLLVLGTLGAITCMTYVPTILFASTGLTSNSEGTRENFRYSFLLDIGFLAIGIAVQLALFTVALKWILAGCAKEGPYRTNSLRTLRRWYLGRLHYLVNAYFLTFNRIPRYDWWSAALGMRVGCDSIVLLMGTYNPEDAHLIEIGNMCHVSHPLLAPDRPTGRHGEREKGKISIGSQSVVGYGMHLSGGSSMSGRSATNGYSILRPGECLPEGLTTMSDVQSSFRLEVAAPGTAKTSVSSTADHHSYKNSANCIDVCCTLGAVLVNVLSVVGSFETTEHVLARLQLDSGFVRNVVLGSVAVTSWALYVSLLLYAFKRIFVGDLAAMSISGGAASSSSIFAGMSSPLSDAEEGYFEHGHEDSCSWHRSSKRESAKLTVEQMMRWRWMQRILSYALFEPFFIEPLLKGTWLLNLWLNLMGADVSMGSLILGKVSDHGLVKVCDGAVVAGVMYGHRVTVGADGEWAMEMTPCTIGERAVVHNHCTSWSANLQPRATLTSSSATLSGQVLEAGEVYGGRPPRKLKGWPC